MEYLFNQALSDLDGSRKPPGPFIDPFAGMKSDLKRMLGALSTTIDGAVDELQYVLRSDSRALGRNLEASGEKRSPGQAATILLRRTTRGLRQLV